ncbi:MAG TPA: hypothetical protein VK554_10295, partial [Bradyrhizobium sp.]|nr:hypothetical protein [Bradyrhizobium sp.]
TVNTINFGTGAYKIENYEARSRVIVTNTYRLTPIAGMAAPKGDTSPNARSTRSHVTSTLIR